MLPYNDPRARICGRYISALPKYIALTMIPLTRIFPTKIYILTKECLRLGAGDYNSTKN